MPLSLRKSVPWCGAGAGIGGAAGAVFALTRSADFVNLIAACLGFSVLGLAFGFVVATFVCAVRHFGVAPLADSALRYALWSLFFSPLFYWMGWSDRPLVEDLITGAVLLGLSGAYFQAANIWMPDVAKVLRQSERESPIS